MKKLFLILGTIMSMMSITSCDDSSIAEKMNGTWHGILTSKTEEGNNVKNDETITYTKTTDDGGDFYSVWKAEEETTMDDGSVITVKYTASIKGYWNILVGDLVMQYSLGTLSVTADEETLRDIAKNTIDNDDEMVFASERDYHQAIAAIAQEIRGECEKAAHKELYSFFEESNKTTKENDYTYPDVKVTDTELIYKTEDAGMVSYKRVK